MKTNLKISAIIILFIAQTIVCQTDRPKIGLVLSGGGARGLAHIGVLKMLDSLQIPVDYIVGTSMGGIMGGLYAIGYSGHEIERFSVDSDWDELFSDSPPRIKIPYLLKKDDGKFQVEFGLDGIAPVIPNALILGQKISLRLADLTSTVASIDDFDKFNIPFRCVAVDLISGKEVVLKKGSLANAIRATMAIPTIFSPVEWGDSLLIDGGVLNNFPADVLKEMGADIIIGVNVGTQLKEKKDLESLVSILEQTMVITDIEKQNAHAKLCNLVIRPDLEEYSISDFETEKAVNIIKLGEAAAFKHKDELLEIKRKYVDPYKINMTTDIIISSRPAVGTFVLSGNSSYPLDYFYELLDIHPNEKLDWMKLNDNISKVKMSGIFDSISVEVIPRGEGIVSLYIAAHEKIKPRIFGISISGNKENSFDFIMKLFGFKAGDVFDKEKMNEQISLIYGLGYFERIGYTIETVKTNYVRLHINVKEKSFRNLSVGFRYDDRYKVVAVLGMKNTNFPFSGLRGEIFLQFAGLFKFDWSLYYPSRTFDLPVFPFVRFAYKNVPIDIYDPGSSDRIAEYNDISTTIAGGIGLNLGSAGVLKFEYNHEYMSINPNISGLDPENFPSWKDKLRKLRAEFSIDLLDDPVTPTRGVLINADWDISMKQIGSDINYQQCQLDASLYHSFNKRNILYLNGYYTNFRDDLPVYKYSLKGGATSFIGMEINQLFGNNYHYARVDYIYEFKKDIFLKLIANVCSFDLKNYFNMEPINKYLYGYGVGVKLLSIVGPFEFIAARGSESITKSDSFKTRFYFTAGFYF